MRTKHHLTPKSRGGRNKPNNILILTEMHHRLWHQLFGNRTIEEVIEVLKRIASAKGR